MVSLSVHLALQSSVHANEGDFRVASTLAIVYKIIESQVDQEVYSFCIILKQV